MPVESRKRVTVTIEWPGLGNIGVFAVRSGGKLGSEITKYADGGGEKEEVHGGRQTYDPITVKRAEKPERDLALSGALAAARGIARASIQDVFLDEHNNPYGFGKTWVGMLEEYTPAESDANGNNVSELELQFQIDGFHA